MRKPARLIDALVVLALVLLPSAPPAAHGEESAPARHPDLRLPTIDGEGEVDLRQFRGRKVLLIEFASW